MNRLNKLVTSFTRKSLDNSSWEILYSRNAQSKELLLSNPYEKSSIAFTCISTTARAISHVPLLIMRKAGPEKSVLGKRTKIKTMVEIEDRIYIKTTTGKLQIINKDTDDLWEPVSSDYPWQKLLDRPNYLLSGSAFIESGVSNLYVGGNVWIIGYPLSSKVVPDALWIAQKEHMSPKRSKETGQLARWDYKPDQDKPSIPIEIEERIAHIRFWNSKDPIIGLSPLDVGKTSMLLDFKASIYSDKFFDHGGTLGGAITTEKKLKKADILEIREGFNQEHEGYEKAHKLAILHSGMKYQQMAATHRDIELLDMRKFSRDDILMILGMKKGVISITEGLNYATLLGQKAEWWESTNIPIMRMFETGINWGILKNEPTLKTMFDLSVVKALQADFKERAEMSKIFTSQGVPFNVVNQRLSLGFPKIEGGDVGYLPYSLVPVNLIGQDKFSEEEPEEIQEDETKRITALKALPPIKKDVWETISYKKWKGFSERLAKLEKGFQGGIKRVFYKTRLNILSILHTGSSGKSKQVICKDLKDNMAAINAYNYKIEKDILKDFAGGYYKDSVKNGGESVFDELGLEADFDLRDPATIRYLSLKRTKIVSVMGTIKDHVEFQISEGILENEDTTQIEKRLKGVFGKANNRARVIARTEVGGAMNFGRNAAIKQTSFKYKFWYTAQDERVRGAGEESVEYNHAMMHKERIRIGRAWDVNGDIINYPGDYKGQPGNVIQCRCIEIVDTDS